MNKGLEISLALSGILFISVLGSMLDWKHRILTFGSTEGNFFRVHTETHQDLPPKLTKKYDLWKGPTQLRGANTWSRLDNHHASPLYTCRDIQALSYLGANYLNISHAGILSEHSEGGRYQLEPDAISNLRQLIQCANSNRMFVVVAFRTGPERHENIFEGNHGPSKVFTNAVAQDAWIEMWKTAVDLLKDNTSVVGYDLMVEPDTGGHPERWNELAKRIIKGIREKDTETPILLEGADGGDLESILKLNARDFDENADQRLVFSLHQYQPNEYTQQTEGRWEYHCPSLRDNKGRPGPSDYVPYSRERTEILRNVYLTLARWRKDQRAFVAVTEFGAIRWAGGWLGDKRRGRPLPDADKFISDQLEMVEELGMNHAIWKWDPDTCQGDDDYNFLHGQMFSSHTESPSGLGKIIKTNWRRNSIRPAF